MMTNDSVQLEPEESVSMIAFKARRRLGTLLSTRRELARTVNEYMSHGLDSLDLWELQLTIEQTVLDEFPDVWDSCLAEWVSEDLAYEHPVSILAPDCRLCEVLAASAHINLSRPEAA